MNEALTGIDDIWHPHIDVEEIYLTVEEIGNLLDEDEIDKIEWDLIEETLNEDGNEESIHRLEEYKTNKYKPFFLWKLYFSDIFNNPDPGFDVVIANPPYIEFKRLDANQKTQYKKRYQSAKGKYDIYVIFLELSKKLMNQNGCMVFINPTMFMKRDYGKSIRKFIVNNYQIEKIIDFSDIQVFENATNYTGVFVFLNSTKEDYNFIYKKFRNIGREINRHEFVNAMYLNLSNDIVDFMNLQKDNLLDSVWNFKTSEIKNILKKISNDSKTLKSITKRIFVGIQSGKDEVFFLNQNTIDNYKIEEDIIYPILKGKDVKKYGLDWSGTFILYPYDKESNALDESYFQNKYPNAYNYLLEKKPLLAGRAYFERSSKKWYELWNQRKFKNLIKIRIVVPEISKENKFALCKEFFGNTKTYHIILNRNDLDFYKYILGLLNSSLIQFYYQNLTVPKAGGFFAYKTQFLNDIPIKIAESSTKLELIDIVDQILNSSNPEVKNRLESKIDQIVYELYKLSDVEIDIIENTLKGGKIE